MRTLPCPISTETIGVSLSKSKSSSEEPEKHDDCCSCKIVYKSFVSFSTGDGFGRLTQVLFLEGTKESHTTDWAGPEKRTMRIHL
jgi:hypothetical protein